MTAPSHYARRRSGLTNTRAGHGTGWFREPGGGTSAARRRWPRSGMILMPSRGRARVRTRA